MKSRRQAVNDAGGNALVAKRLGVSEQRLSNWIERGVPVAHCAQFEHAVEGRWMRWDERPRDWSLIWPEMARMDGAPAPRDAEAEVQDTGAVVYAGPERRNPARPSPYSGTEYDRRASAGEG